MMPMTMAAVNNRLWQSSRRAAPPRPASPRAKQQPGEEAKTDGARLAEGEKGKVVDPTHRLQKLLDEQSVALKGKPAKK